MSTYPQIRSNRGGVGWRWAVIAGFALLIFVTDTITDYEIAAAAFYGVVVLLAAEFFGRGEVIAVTLACVVLTVISLFITKSGHFEAGAVNAFLSICAVATTAYLALKRSAAIAAEVETRGQLAHLARVNALGELATSIAHEVNQPLAAIVTSGNASINWLASDPPNLPKAKQAIQRMVDDANRASAIIGRVRKLSKRSKLAAAWLSSADLVNEVLLLCRRELDRNNISVATTLPANIPLVFADAVQIQQVLLNMILNAIESIAKDRGRDGRIVVDVHAAHDKAVEFVVRDNGAGIPEASLGQIFDAFYTTKAEGVGIGLAISRSIIESHGGRIWATAPGSGGAAFHFTLPGREAKENK